MKSQKPEYAGIKSPTVFHNETFRDLSADKTNKELLVTSANKV